MAAVTQDLLTREEIETLRELFSSRCGSRFQNLCDMALAYLDSKTPQGWQLVPIEPTVAMNGAGMEMRASRQAEETLTSITSRQYKAMLAAAPTLSAKDNNNEQ